MLTTIDYAESSLLSYDILLKNANEYIKSIDAELYYMNNNSLSSDDLIELAYEIDSIETNIMADLMGDSNMIYLREQQIIVTIDTIYANEIEVNGNQIIVKIDDCIVFNGTIPDNDSVFDIEIDMNKTKLVLAKGNNRKIANFDGRLKRFSNTQSIEVYGYNFYNNTILDTFTNFTNLKSLILDGCELYKFDAIRIPSSLTDLTIINSTGQLRPISVAPCQNLISLKANVPLVGLSNMQELEHLDLSNVDMRLNDLMLMPKSLRSLRINLCILGSLTNYMFSTCCLIESISISNCIEFNRNLPEDLFDGLTSLKTIDLYNNQISSIHPLIFKGLWSLERINLSNNQLTKIHRYQFSGMLNITSINISNNDIPTLDNTMFNNLPNLKLLTVCTRHRKSRFEFIDTPKVGIYYE